jgi:hypothetical protein
MQSGLSALNRPLVQFLIVAGVGLALRFATFGDPNLYIDESYYLLVGHEMHAGAIPYVDIWDRKPLGIFLTYWLFAAFPNGVLAYQIGAWLSASLTAFFIVRIACRWAPPRAALLSGAAYLATASVLLGLGGQSPIFYNSFVSGAALLMFRYGDDRSDRSLYAAMLLLGMALTYKQPVVFEAAFFGLLGLSIHRDWRKAAISIALGALPWAVISLWYFAAGHWHEFFHAMVMANLNRPSLPSDLVAENALMVAVELCVLVGSVIFAFVFCRDTFPARTMGPWILAAAMGFLSVPFFVEHYALPLIVPLCIAASAAFARKPAGPLLAVMVIGVAAMIAEPFNFARYQQSKASFARMVAAIGPIGAGERLLIYDGPPLLYHAAGTRPGSVLAFPGHINNIYERDVSHIPTVPELRRLIAAEPSVVVMTPSFVTPPDWAAFRSLMAYVKTRCRPPVRVILMGAFGKPSGHLVYKGCSRNPR